MTGVPGAVHASLEPMSVPGRVSIILRTKNRPRLLARALDDVLAQTFTDWHLVIVNDVGDPAPVDALVAERDARFSGRVSVVHRTASAGMEDATNTGLAQTEGAYVCVHDDDDTWDPEFLATTVGHLDAHPGQAAVVTRTIIVLEELDGDRVVEVGRHPFWADLTDVTLSDLLRINRFVPIGLLYRRAVHATIGTYREELAVAGDWDFHLRLLSAYAVGFVDRPLAFWHQRPGAAGAASNSITQDADHARFDLLVRDLHLRDYVERNGAGGLLYLTRLLTDEFEALHRRLDTLQERVDAAEAASREVGLIALARRKYHLARHHWATRKQSRG